MLCKFISGNLRLLGATAGFYSAPLDAKKYPRLQLLTIDEILHGKNVEFPGGVSFNVTHKRAPKAKCPSRERQGDFL